MLVMTRRKGGSVYGGAELTEDIEDTYDHIIRVENIVYEPKSRSAEISVRSAVGKYESFELTPIKDDFRVNPDLRIVLVGMYTDSFKGGPLEPVLRLGFDAPMSYRLVRDDAIRRTG
jgi:hypothetical protein